MKRKSPPSPVQSDHEEGPSPVSAPKRKKSRIDSGPSSERDNKSWNVGDLSKQVFDSYFPDEGASSKFLKSKERHLKSIPGELTDPSKEQEEDTVATDDDQPANPSRKGDKKKKKKKKKEDDDASTTTSTKKKKKKKNDKGTTEKELKEEDANLALRETSQEIARKGPKFDVPSDSAQGIKLKRVRADVPDQSNKSTDGHDTTAHHKRTKFSKNVLDKVEEVLADAGIQDMNRVLEASQYSDNTKFSFSESRENLLKMVKDSKVNVVTKDNLPRPTTRDQVEEHEAIDDSLMNNDLVDALKKDMKSKVSEIKKRASKSLRLMNQTSTVNLENVPPSEKEQLKDCKLYSPNKDGGLKVITSFLYDDDPSDDKDIEEACKATPTRPSKERHAAASQAKDQPNDDNMDRDNKNNENDDDDDDRAYHSLDEIEDENSEFYKIAQVRPLASFLKTTPLSYADEAYASFFHNTITSQQKKNKPGSSNLSLYCNDVTMVTPKDEKWRIQYDPTDPFQRPCKHVYGPGDKFQTPTDIRCVMWTQFGQKGFGRECVPDHTSLTDPPHGDRRPCILCSLFQDNVQYYFKSYLRLEGDNTCVMQNFCYAMSAEGAKVGADSSSSGSLVYNKRYGIPTKGPSQMLLYPCLAFNTNNYIWDPNMGRQRKNPNESLGGLREDSKLHFQL